MSLRHVNEIMDSMFSEEEIRKAKRQEYRDGMYHVRRELGYEPDPEPQDDEDFAQ